MMEETPIPPSLPPTSTLPTIVEQGPPYMLETSDIELSMWSPNHLGPRDEVAGTTAEGAKHVLPPEYTGMEA